MKWYVVFGVVLLLAITPALTAAFEERERGHSPVMMGNESMNNTSMMMYAHGKEFAEKRKELQERWKERLEEIKEYRERIKDRNEHIREMKERYKEKYMEEREKYEQLKHRGLDDPEVFNYARGFVVNGIGFAIAHLDSLENRVIAMNLSDDRTAEILGDIDVLKVTLEEWKAVINNSTTPEELRENVKEFREEWQLIRIKINAVTSKVVALKFEEVIEKAENRTWMIEDKIAALKELGVDTSEIEEAYHEYLSGLAEAKGKITEALQHFENAINANTYSVAKEEYEEGKDAYHEAIDKFKDTMDELRDVFKEYAERMRYLNENSTASES
ncbi:hypothetical protein [Geoglobus ahangari]